MLDKRNAKLKRRQVSSSQGSEKAEPKKDVEMELSIDDKLK